ncbi:hypothetical protein [Actinoplanes sp. NPDC049681]|uniref:hypothetical protein n=1 Tax=Actinoplanes sp. NPDC049681 TaxID=3363905 RepID=UPI00379A7E07
MARRFATPADFELVGMSSDPTPGDPEHIEDVVRRYAEIGDAAEKALSVLKRDGSIATGRGSAMDQLREKVGDDLPDKLAKTARSYHDAADAMRAYTPRLREAQDTFDRAVEQARQAAPQAHQTPPAPAPDATGEEKAAAVRAQDGIDAAKGQMSAARGLAEQAQSMREAAEKTCADALDRAAGEAIPERNFFQKIADFFADFPFVQILLGLLLAVVSVFFPVVGLLLGAALFAVTQIVAIATGAFKLGDFLIGLLGLIPGASVLKVVGSGLKAGAGLAAKVVPQLAKTVNGSITGIRTTINTSRTIGPLVNSSAARFAGSGAKGFAEGATDEVAAQAINGDGFDATQIATAGGLGAGGELAGHRGTKGDTASGGIPVKTAPADGTSSRGIDTDTTLDPGARPPSPSSLPGMQDVFFPHGTAVKSQDPLILVHPTFPHVDLEFQHHIDGDPVFKVKDTGETVYFDLDDNTFRKFEGDGFTYQEPLADFTRFQGPVPTDHFVVKNFEGQDLTQVGSLGELHDLPRTDQPVLVPTDQIPDSLLRGDAEEARVDRIVQAFRDGTPLPPIGLAKDDLSINDGNHRIIAAKRLGLPFVPVRLS